MMIPSLTTLGLVIGLLAVSALAGASSGSFDTKPDVDSDQAHAVADNEADAIGAPLTMNAADGKEKQNLRRKAKPACASSMCFSGVNTVEIHSNKTVAMKDLQVGDMVKDADGKMVPVYGFAQYKPNAHGYFLQIHARGISKPLEITERHLVFVNGCAIPASTVRVGDQLDLGAALRGVAEVAKVNKVVRTGVFNPYTASGTIMVNGVAASNYVTSQADSNHSFLKLGGFETNISLHWFAHVFHSVPRMVCLTRADVCDWERLNKWSSGTMLIGSWLEEQNWIVAAAAFAPLMLLGLMVYLVEMAFFGNLFAVAIALTVIVAIKVVQGNPAKKAKKVV